MKIFNKVIILLVIVILVLTNIFQLVYNRYLTEKVNSLQLRNDRQYELLKDK